MEVIHKHMYINNKCVTYSYIYEIYIKYKFNNKF